MHSLVTTLPFLWKPKVSSNKLSCLLRSRQWVLRKKPSMNLFRRIVRSIKQKWRLRQNTKDNLKNNLWRIEKLNNLKRILTLEQINWISEQIWLNLSHHPNKEKDDERRELKRDKVNLVWAIKDEVDSNIPVVHQVNQSISVSSRIANNSTENLVRLTISFEQRCLLIMSQILNWVTDQTLICFIK